MIKEDFATSVRFLQTEAAPFNERITNDIDTDVYNNIFRSLEEQLNSLYEKIRVLEDIHDYTKDFVQRSIKERRKEIESDLKVIQMSTEALKGQDCVVKVVEFYDCNDQILDKDGSVLSNLVVTDGCLTLDSKALFKQNISLIQNTGEFKEMDRKVDNDIITATCRYSMGSGFDICQLSSDSFRDQASASQPVDTENRYEIYFDDLIDKCNYFSCTPVNCEIVNIKIVDGDDMATEISQGFFDEQYVKKIVLKIKYSGFQRSVISIPYYDYGDSFSAPVNKQKMIEGIIL